MLNKSLDLFFFIASFFISKIANYNIFKNCFIKNNKIAKKKFMCRLFG